MISQAEIADAQKYLRPVELAQLDGLLEGLPPEFVDRSFPEQAAFIEDPSPLKLLICTRRSGKSTAAGWSLLQACYENPGVSTLYIALTRQSAERIMCKDILTPINEQLGLGGVLHKTELSWRFPNRSMLYMLGLDSNENEKRKVFGQKFKRVVIDEAALYTINLRELIYSVLKPSVIDLGGDIMLMGMPSNIKVGVFFEATDGQDSCNPGRWTWTDTKYGHAWSGHRWSAWQNPYTRDQWKDEIAGMKKINPLIEKTAIFQQEYLGRWVVDDTKLVYRYVTGDNDFDKLPNSSTWQYVLGVDLGYEDDTAFVILAWCKEIPCIYVIEASKEPKLIIPDVASRIGALRTKYKLNKIVIDGAAKQSVETLRRMYGLPLTATEKQGKWDFIQIMNGDFVSQRIKLGPNAGALKKEYRELVKDPNSDIDRENPTSQNHATDAALYAYRNCYHYISKVPEVQPAEGTPEWNMREDKRMREATQKLIAQRQLQQQQEMQ